MEIRGFLLEHQVEEGVDFGHTKPLQSKTAAEGVQPNNLVTEIATILRQEVDRQGTITFARFMEIALYCPKLGYYEQADRVGRQGDFYTSVSVGAVFGELLSFQFSKWLQESSCYPDDLSIVEAGAHDGQLAIDVLTNLRRSDTSAFKRIRYYLIEPSETRQIWQRKTLADFADQVRWVRGISEIPPRSLNGIIFSNELLDAFPVHRLAWNAQRRLWFEWGVGWVNGDFVWQAMHSERDFRSEIASAGFDLSPDLEAVLPDGFIVELCPSAAAWWRQASEVLAAGHLMAIDYGFGAEELMRPERHSGTLRAYSHHRLTSNVLSSPGEQDLTAHVNFTPIIKAGERAGLKTLAYSSQERFLTPIVMELFRSVEGGGAPLTAKTSQLKALIEPSQFGHSFRVLVQHRGREPLFVKP